MTTIDSALDKAHVYYDISALHELRSAEGTEAEKVQATAKQFESMMLNLMFKAMRKANDVFADGNMLNSHSTQFYQDMLDQQLSLSMTRGGGLGLAEMLAKQLTQDYRQPPSTGYRSLADYPRQAFQQTPEPNPASPLSQRELEALDNVAALVDKLFASSAGKEQLRSEELSPTGLSPTGLSRAGLPQVELPEVGLPPTGMSQTKLSENTVLAISEPLQFSTPKEFIETLLPAAQQVAREMGVDPRLLLAQAALETGWGKNMITEQGQPSFNLFGIKADSSWPGEVTRVATTEFRQGVRLKEQAEFRAYQSYNESFRDYLQFIKTNVRYESALASRSEPKAYAEALQAAGYATDPEYAKKIFRIYQQLGDYSVVPGGAAERASGQPGTEGGRG
jgi:peptidoglycan hydrolase FlgJ